MQRCKVTIKKQTGIAEQMRNFCRDNRITIWTFLSETIQERLRCPLNFSITEIEEMQKRPYEKDAEFERFDFGITDAIAQEQLRMIKEDYGIAQNTFFVKTIAEKLQSQG